MVITRNKISRTIIYKMRSGKDVLSKEEIINIIREYERIYKKKINLISLWTYLRKGNYIKRILGDYYYVYSLEERYNRYYEFSEEELVFKVLEKMDVKWYLGLERALKENKITWQVLNVVTIINNHFSGIKELGNTKFKFIKTTEKRVGLGLIEKKTSNGVKYFYSDLEKTYLDFLHFYSYDGKDISAVKQNLDFEVKNNKLKQYAKNYSKKVQAVI